MENIDGILPLMQQLVDLGVGFSVDDFGTGYSSLSYLKHLPIRSLKIDRSFIKRLPQNNADAAIVKTIIDMAANLNHRVIAEGVETKEQMDFLRGLDCDALQGYYFSRPVPPSELAALLAGGDSTAA